MGKGDRKTKKGKIWRGTYGKTRTKTKKTAPLKPTAKKEAEEKKAKEVKTIEIKKT